MNRVFNQYKVTCRYKTDLDIFRIQNITMERKRRSHDFESLRFKMVIIHTNKIISPKCGSTALNGDKR